MANTKSAKKAVRSSARKNKNNSVLKRKYKKDRKEILKITDKKSALKNLPAAMKSIDKAAKGGAIHKNTAARYKSRLAKAVNKK